MPPPSPPTPVKTLMSHGLPSAVESVFCAFPPDKNTLFHIAPTFIHLPARNVNTALIWVARPGARSLTTGFFLAFFFFFFSKSWKKMAELLIKFVARHRRRANIVDERVWIQMSLGGLKQWTEASKINLYWQWSFPFRVKYPLCKCKLEDRMSQETPRNLSALFSYALTGFLFSWGFFFFFCLFSLIISIYGPKLHVQTHLYMHMMQI